MKPTPSPTGQLRLAVLIDADNAQPAVIGGLLAEVARFGVASVRRIYGDFTSTQQTQWKRALLKHSIQPVLKQRAQFSSRPSWPVPSSAQLRVPAQRPPPAPPRPATLRYR